MVRRAVARIALQHVVHAGDRLQKTARRLGAGTRLDLVGVVAEDDVLRGAAGIVELEEQCREQLPVDAEVPLFGVRRLVLVAVARDARVCGDQLRGRRRLDRHNRRKGIGNRSDPREVERIGFVIDVLRDHERHVEVIEVTGGIGTREVGDAKASPQDRRGITGEVVGEAQTRREVEIVRLFVRTAAHALFARVDDAEGLIVEVREAIGLFCGCVKDLVAQAGIDREPAIDFEIVLHEGRLFDDLELRLFSRNPREALLK